MVRWTPLGLLASSLVDSVVGHLTVLEPLTGSNVGR